MSARDYGIFARVFPTAPARDVAAAIAAAGYGLTQLNLRAIGLPSIPLQADWSGIDPGAVRDEFAAAGVLCWGLSGSYNMAHPDPGIRRAGTNAAIELVRHAAAFGATAVTLCTGSRDPERMWAHHPDNRSDAAWADMRAELEPLLDAASDAQVMLAIEPEPGTIVCDATATLRLYREIGTRAALLGVVADSANLLAGRPPDSHRGVLERSFSSLADRIVCLHAKDLVPWTRTLAGEGVVDYEHVAELYRRLGLSSPVIVQDVPPAEAAAALAFLRARFDG